MLELAPFVRHQPQAPQRPAALRAWAVAVLLVLAVVQLLVGSLGLIHQSVHGAAHSVGPRSSAFSALTAVGALQPRADAARLEHWPNGLPSVDAEAHAAGHALAHWFGGHHSDSDCEWFDRMALGGALLPNLPDVITLLPAHSLGWTAHALLLRQSPALFWARGPPAALG